MVYQTKALAYIELRKFTMLIDTVTSACKIGAIKGKSGHRQHYIDKDVSRHLWVTLYHGINLFIINSFLVLINNESMQIHLEYNHIAVDDDDL